ncbi:MAG TPA: hypothetical protein PLA43_00390 [Bryobacteraceae bacterium]|nr:hypothetical protein [Bryobacteraceae bacterium]HPQ15323.1 hypothetical protein [Bryobacteraceae bacterium]HPU70383.1 hypothetical protein [Bryobacteraceae bacterium]
MLDRRWILAAVLAGTAVAQVYSPRVVRQGDPDASSIRSFVNGILDRARVTGQRERAEAIWRFFLADGRFVKPGFWYRLDGWAYEEPGGLVTDPLKLLNSYGFGTSAQLAALLEAAWEAAGFPDARVWSLGGHTVAEVFYDGAYHYYDSDHMGYTTAGKGPFRQAPVVSVRNLEQEPGILLAKFGSRAEANAVDHPWFPSFRPEQMESFARLFSTAADNRVFPFTRYPQGHSMAFVLRPGERLIRHFAPEQPDLYYLPPVRPARAEDGPRSPTDDRRWATGRIEYTPVLSDVTSYYPEFRAGFNSNLRLPSGNTTELTRLDGAHPGVAVFEMPCPYVIIDARLSVRARLETVRQTLMAEFSTNGGRTWSRAGLLRGPYRGQWEVKSLVPRGTYGYLVRFTMSGGGEPADTAIDQLTITTTFQHNPRALAHLTPGRNEMVYQSGAAEVRRLIPAGAGRLSHAHRVTEAGNELLVPEEGRSGSVVFELAAPGGAVLTGFEAGGRFLDLRGGLAPDKLTAGVRKTKIVFHGSPEASLEWSLAPGRDFKPLWKWSDEIQWRDGDAINRVLRWPEVDFTVNELPPGVKKVYVRYRFANLALDSIRLAVRSRASDARSPVEITHTWRESGQLRRHVERIAPGGATFRYFVETGPTRSITNESLTLYCPPVMR